jgi:hypothetical protein
MQYNRKIRTLFKMRTEMLFVVSGLKAKPVCGKNFIPEIDLLCDSKRSIRSRQRKITSIHIMSWEKIDSEGPRKYNKARLRIWGIHQN